MGKMEKNGKKIMQLKWPKYPKPKDKNIGWTKQKMSESILSIDYRVGACGSDMVGGGQEIIIVIAITIVQLVVTNADLDGA